MDRSQRQKAGRPVRDRERQTDLFDVNHCQFTVFNRLAATFIINNNHGSDRLPAQPSALEGALFRHQQRLRDAIQT